MNSEPTVPQSLTELGLSLTPWPSDGPLLSTSSPSSLQVEHPSDSPLLALLNKNPNVFTTLEEALEHATRLRQLRTSPQSLRAALASESDKLSRKRPKKPSAAKLNIEDMFSQAISAGQKINEIK